MTLEGAAKDQLLSHDRSLGDDEGTARGERRMNAGGAIVVVGAGIKAQLEFEEESRERAPVPAPALIRRGV